MKQENNLYPNIRFKGFEGAWERYRLGKVGDIFSGGTPSISNKLYYGGNIPFIRSGDIHKNYTELFLSEKGLENSSAKMIEKGDILYALYGATSGEVNVSNINGAINQAILAIRPFNQFNKYFICEWLRLKKNKILNKYLQGGQGNLSASVIKNLEISFPISKEQEIVGNFIWNIEKLKIFYHKIKLLKLIKKGLLQKLFVNNNFKYPEIRFKEFNDAWEKCFNIY